MQRPSAFGWIPACFISFLFVVSASTSYAQVEIRDTIRIYPKADIDDVTTWLWKQWLDTASVPLLKSTRNSTLLAIRRTGKSLEMELTWGPLGLVEFLVLEPDGFFASFPASPSPSGSIVQYFNNSRNDEGNGLARYTNSNALEGRYTIFLHYLGSFKDRSNPPINFQVKIRFGGELVQTLSGTLPRGFHRVGTYTTPISVTISVTLSLDPAEVRPCGTGGNNEARVLLKVTRNQQPVSGEEVEVRTFAILPSGGHKDHPAYPADQLGIFSWNGKEGNPLVVTTNDQGEVDNLVYKSGEFSVLMKFIAKHVESGSQGTLEKQIEVLLKELQPGFFLLKPIETVIQQKHPSPYWVVEGIEISLDEIATEYSEAFPPVSDNDKLTITDASLQYGGRYEINGDWVHSEHLYHRRGLDVDLRSKNVPLDEPYKDPNRNGIYDDGEPFTDRNGNGKRDTNRTILEEILSKKVLEFKLEFEDKDNEHYHLYFWFR